MDSRKTALQRAFELAQTGKYWNVLEIIHRLKAEKYDVAQVEGPALKRQLMQLVEKAREQSHADQVHASLGLVQPPG
jgi:hypothetical protein